MNGASHGRLPWCILAVHRNDKDVHETLVVAGAVSCGICDSKEDPVALPELGWPGYVTRSNPSSSLVGGSAPS